MASAWIAFVVTLLAVSESVSGQSTNLPFTYVTPDCSGSSPAQYFDTTTLSCQSCGTNQVKSTDGQGCACPANSRITQIVAGAVVCDPCPSNQVVSKDGWSCLPCDSAIPPDSATNYCSACPGISATAEYLLNGTADSAGISCVTCTGGTFRSPDGGRCIPCPRVLNMKTAAGVPSTTCDCSGSVSVGGSSYNLQTLGGVCFATSGTATTTGAIVGMTGIVTQLPNLGATSSVDSLYLKDNLEAAYGLCTASYANRTACQLVGSSCALLLYRQTNVGGSTRDACNLFNELSARTDINNANSDWKRGLPWLYHTNAPSLLTSTDIPTSFRRLDTIQFVAAAFSQNGTFQGYRSVTNGLLQLCPNSRNELNAAYAFGTRYSSSCSLLVDDLFDQAKNPLIFYDLYLRITSTGGTEQLFPVPVKILNLRGVSNNFPNQQSNTNNFVLTRRFFLVDSVGAVAAAGQRPAFVRYASSMRFDIQLINTDTNTRDGRIYPPVLTVGYSEVTSDEFGLGRTVDASFEVAYYSTQAFFWEALKISMGVLGALGGLYAIFRAFAMHNRSGGQNFEATTLLHLIAFGCSAIANVFLIVVYGCAIWYFSVYKNQTVFAFFIPTAQQELNLIVYIAIAGALKLVEIIYVLVTQTRVDIFLMDWEKPKTESSGQQQRGEEGRINEVTYWRTILIANEWNEIQTHRKTSRTFTLLVLLFFMSGLGFENYASGDPQLSRFVVADEYRSATVTTFRFALAVSVFIGAAGVQWLWTLLIHERFIEDKLRNFVDLCSICNISVFIRYPRAFGYYIHGESPHSTADIGVTQLHRQFEKEKEGKCDRRGLDNTDNQTFMMRLPPNFLTVFDSLYRKLVDTASSAAMGTPDAIHKYHEMNRFLTDFINRKDNLRVGSEREAREIEKFQIQPRKFVEDVVGLELGNNEQLQQGGIFYSEDGTSFGDVLFYGNELSLITFDILVYCCTDLIFGNTAVNVIVAWAFGKVLDFMRHHFGEINLSRKTLTDRQFLI